MKNLILVILNWLHLVATVIWIGGIAFILFIAIPSAKELLGSGASRIMAIISRRFTPFANYSILLLIVTGIFIMLLNGGFNADLSYFALKHTAVLIMIIIHFYRGFVIAPKILRAQAAQKLKLQKLSLSLVKVNFVLGLGVLLLSAIIATV
jgi:uncharacterized membrane protein